MLARARALFGTLSHQADRGSLRRTARSLGFVAATFSLLMGLGLWAGAQDAATHDAAMRDRLVTEASSVARLVNPDLARELTFTRADVDLPAYEIIRDQMVARAGVLSVLGIYSVQLRDGTLYFGPEAYPESTATASLPGDSYQSPPAAALTAFTTRRAVAGGPYTDEYGSFVSAFAPVVDPRTGAVILVVGLDVAVSDWQGGLEGIRAGAAVVAFAAFLLTLLAAAFVSWRNRRRSASDLRLRAWIILPVAVVVLGGISLSFYRQNEQVADGLNRARIQATEQAASSWDRLAYDEAQLLRIHADRVASDRGLIDLWQGGEDPAMSSYATRTLSDLGGAIGANELSLMAPDGHTVLHVGDGDRAARSNDRFLLEEVIRTGASAWGFELRPAGRMSLVYIRPVISESRLLGYIQLGIDSGYLSRQLAGSIGGDVVTIVRKAYASESAFEAAGLSAAWAQYPDLAVTDRTLTSIPADVATRIGTGWDELVATGSFQVDQDGRLYDAGFVTISDASGRDVGGILVLSAQPASAEAAVGASNLTLGLELVFLLGLLALLWSITGRAEGQFVSAFATLRGSEETYRRQFADNSLPMLLVDPDDGVLIDANAAAIRFYGHPADRLVGMNMADISEGDGSSGPDRDAATCTPEGGAVVDGRHRLADGSVRDVELAASAISLGELPVVHLIVADITDRKRAEDALRSSETRIRAITDSAQDAVLMMDSRGLISYWNPAAERVFGWSIDEALGKPLHDLIAADRFRGAVDVALPRFFTSGQGAALGRTLDMVGRRRDGSEFPVQLSLSGVQLGGEWHAVGVMRDDTDRNRAERDLLAINTALESTVARANEMAQHAEHATLAKSEFLANMSHEIRTPLNGVIGMTGLLLDTELDGIQRHYAESARSSGESLLALINDILDFSKIEAGHLELESIDFDLRALVEDLSSILALRADEKQIELICSVEPDVPSFVTGDPGRLRQILLNLAGNALKFTQQGEVAVRGSLVKREGRKLVVRFSVKDTGIGIPADVQRTLFQKFVQADTSTTRRYGGTGLGLAISRQLSEMMGGEIGLASEEGVGSEFWFTVKLKMQADQKKPLRPATMAGNRVIVVDDNATNREVLLGQLIAWGARVGEASSGVEALALMAAAAASGEPFKAAILDMQMPDVDGVGLARAIKADAALSDTLLVLLTSLGHSADGDEFARAGFAACLVKPARPSELFDSLAGLMAGPRADEGPALRPTIASMPVRLDRSRPAADLALGSVRILLAEDNITSQQVALGVLKKLGLGADAVSDGAQAIAALERDVYDLVLMDIQMPTIDGLEATRRIRDPQSAVLRHDIPIIAMTAHALRGDREICLKAGMNDYVQKPISATTLADSLARWLPAGVDTAPVPAGPALRRLAPAAPLRAGPPPPPSPVAAAAQIPVVTVAADGRASSEPLDFDLDDFLARLDGDRGLAADVAEGFLEDAPRLIERLGAAIEADDPKEMAFSAHTIKGACGNVSAGALRAIALDMEQAGNAGRMENAAANLGIVRARFERLRDAMDALLAERDRSDRAAS
jgi:PAS domain S-box-containing protein